MEKVRVWIEAVKRGDMASRVLGMGAVISDRVPADGIIACVDVPGGLSTYVTLADIQRAISARKKGGNPDRITAESWDTEGEGNG